jgi:hypothetical protein
MFSLLSRSQQRNSRIREALVQSGLATAGDPNRVIVLENNGQYSGRRVRFFRAFHAGNQDVVLAAGHVEHDGVVVVNRLSAQEGAVPMRWPANRAIHADDDRWVFWDPARTWTAEPSPPAPVTP